MVISFTGLWLVRVVLCCLTGWVFHWSISAIWWSFVLDQTVRAAISMFVFWKKKAYHAAGPEPGQAMRSISASNS